MPFCKYYTNIVYFDGLFNAKCHYIVKMTKLYGKIYLISMFLAVKSDIMA